MRILGFYVIAFLYSWGIWFGSILLKGVMELPVNLLVSLGGLGPVLALAGMLVFWYTPAERREFLHRLGRWRTITLPVLCIIVLLPLMSITASNLIAGLIDRSIPLLALDSQTLEKGVPYLLFLFVFGPLPEEMAWRGIAFDDLSKRSVLTAQLLVSILWAAWHIPLFFLEGSYQWELGIGTPSFWFFFLNLITTSWIYGWIYITSSSSILAVILFHYAVNLTGELTILTGSAEMIDALVLGIFGIGALINSCSTS